MNRLLTGPAAQHVPTPTADKILPPRPAWFKIPAADVERMARLRQSQ